MFTPSKSSAQKNLVLYVCRHVFHVHGFGPMTTWILNMPTAVTSCVIFISVPAPHQQHVYLSRWRGGLTTTIFIIMSHPRCTTTPLHTFLRGAKKAPHLPTSHMGTRACQRSHSTCNGDHPFAWRLHGQTIKVQPATTAEPVLQHLQITRWTLELKAIRVPLSAEREWPYRPPPSVLTLGFCVLKLKPAVFSLALKSRWWRVGNGQHYPFHPPIHRPTHTHTRPLLTCVCHFPPHIVSPPPSSICRGWKGFNFQSKRVSLAPNVAA